VRQGFGQGFGLGFGIAAAFLCVNVLGLVLAALLFLVPGCLGVFRASF
jgi:hypothetical protein